MSSENIINIEEILNIIPHRYPMLLVDRVIEYTPNKSIIGLKNVTFNEPHFMGHFPQRPIMPGVLIIEAMAQLAAVLVAKSMNSTGGKEVFFMSIEQSKFRKVVAPGDQLIMEADIMQNRGPVWKFTAVAKVDGQIAAETVFSAMVKDKQAD